MTAKLSPPFTPRSERADGQEFGLVPKYVLRKRKKTDSCTKGNDQVGPTMKDLQENDIPHKTPEQADKLFKETNSLLARRWRLSTLVDSDHDKKLLLETENFDPTAAANRIENNCRTKMELFGPELMDKKIALHGDLSSGKSEIGVEDGFVQLLATRDLGGRAVLFFQYDSNIYAKQSQNFRKTLYYMMASALEDSETVRRGMSLVVFNSDPAKWFDPFWKAFGKISTPFRISKLHYCQVLHYDSSYQVLEKREIHRGSCDVRIHRGSLQECMHGLVTYGIPSHFIPLNPVNGSINLEEHLRWIELRRRIESFPANHQASIVLVPGQEDVLLGKRKMSMNGNVLYHQTIMKNIKLYHDAILEERNGILRKVWDSVNVRGGRFLLQIEDGQLWENLDVKPALYHIRQAFDFLCMQLYAPKTTNLNGAANGKSIDDDDMLFRWDLGCFNLVHCESNKQAPACW